MEILSFIFAVIAAVSFAISSIYQFLQENMLAGCLYGLACILMIPVAIKQLD